ncbi:hypothetical protein M0R45_026615 [Rubus argutus]|uniref:Uncharacterized protein n=1 Tax=Rubus argutus TaxID=59490 RepID=A0AAW1X0E7_RUBAR
MPRPCPVQSHPKSPRRRRRAQLQSAGPPLPTPRSTHVAAACSHAAVISLSLFHHCTIATTASPSLPLAAAKERK